MGKLAAVILAATFTLAACSSGTHSSGDPAACKAAMTRAYEYALAHPDAPPATEPPACKGLPDATVSRFATEIMASVTPSAG